MSSHINAYPGSERNGYTLVLLELDWGRLGRVSRSALFKFVILNVWYHSVQIRHFKRVISSLHLRR